MLKINSNELVEFEISATAFVIGESLVASRKRSNSLNFELKIKY